MAKLDLGQYTGQLIKGGPNRWTMVGAALRSIENAVNNLGQHTAADPVGNAQTPPPIQGLQVKVSGEIAHAVITDNNAINKGVHYFVEMDTDPSFPKPHVMHFGTSRAPAPFALPGLNDDSVAQTYYFRAYSQYPGSKPGQRINFGGQTPIGVTPSPTTPLTLIPSTGSGTAAPNGQQGGSGFGKINRRPAPRPKRSVQS